MATPPVATISAASIQAVAKAVLGQTISGNYTLGQVILATKEQQDTIASGGNDAAALQAIIVAALQSPAGRAAIRAAIQ